MYSLQEPDRCRERSCAVEFGLRACNRTSVFSTVARPSFGFADTTYRSESHTKTRQPC